MVRNACEVRRLAVAAFRCAVILRPIENPLTQECPVTSITPLPALRLRPEWTAAMGVRTSRRSYAGVALTGDQAARMASLCEELSAVYGDARVVFVNKPADEVFSGIVGAYGVVIQNAPAFAAFVARGEHLGDDAPGATALARFPMYADLDVGRLGEAVVLEATALDLGTCWVAGSFDRERTAEYVSLEAGERIRAVTPIGLAADREGVVQRAMQRLIRARSRRELSEIAPGSEAWPSWAVQAAEAVRIAPSGKNGQPWRLRLEGDALVLAHAVGEQLVPTYMADMGIALLHAEIALADRGVAGTWTFGRPTDSGEVARFVRSSSTAE